ncbi:hypothetical protein [Herbiconiux liangxiaofengii]|uniref:hypothetical protein n=1 Tax=Herbiconiux liangxiaofengii TaxID=3342795 RepID=UPI0035BA85EC
MTDPTPPPAARPANPTPVNWTPGAGTRSRIRTADDDGALTRLVRARRLGPGAADAVRQDIARDPRLGIGYLGVGAVIVGAMLICRGLFSLAWTWNLNDLLPLTVTAWFVVMAAFASTVLIALRTRGTLPLWAWTGLLVADALALTLDHVAVLSSADTDYFTVSVGVGATLAACATFRPLANVLVAAITLTALEVVVLAAQAFTDPAATANGVQQTALSVGPVFAALLVVHSFSNLVQRELDRTIAESTIGAPRYGLGLVASTELTRLDLAAERLLQEVASGRTPLPLDRAQTATAAGLANDLRRLLVAGRRETWLHHAIAESEYLSTAVHLSDPDGLAGYLEPAQREGLLSAVWLIVDESGRYTPTIDVKISRPGSLGTADPLDRMVLPTTLSIGGIPRRRIDPGVWSALSRVGQYTVETRSGRLRVGVDAHVVVPDASR